MRITNRHGLPEPLVRAVTPTKTPQERRGGADISVTELIGPPLIRKLRDQNWDLLEDDASNRLWMLFGIMCHDILHRHADGKVAEKELVITRHGWRIRGQFDLLDESPPMVMAAPDGAMVLTDYKVTSVWSMVFKDQEEDREAQLNIYRLMLIEKLGMRVDRLENQFFFRDWRANEQLRDPKEYPERSAMRVQRAIWPNEKIEQYITGRLREHSRPDPVCSPKDRCHRGDQWAVMKTGGKRAVRVWDSEEEAQKFVEEFSVQHAGQYSIEKREGVSARCLRFCPVWQICPVGQVARRGMASLEEP